MSLGPIWSVLGRFGQTKAKTALDGTHWAPVYSELRHEILFWHFLSTDIRPFQEPKRKCRFGPNSG